MGDEERLSWIERLRQVQKDVERTFRVATFEEKLQQLSTLMYIARALNLQEHTQEEVDAVRDRWIRLKGREASERIPTPSHTNPLDASC